MEIEILTFDGCPNSEVAIARAAEAVRNAGITANVRTVEIIDAADAIARRFLGSPTIRVDGEDVEPQARARRGFGLMCRTYRDPDGNMTGAPSVELIVKAIKDSSSAGG